MDGSTLAIVLYQNELLKLSDMYCLQLTIMTESKKVEHIYRKMVYLGKEGYEKFLSCLKHRYASQYYGHIKLYEILSKSQQEIHQYQTNVTSLESSLDADNFNSKLLKIQLPFIDTVYSLKFLRTKFLWFAKFLAKVANY